MLHAQYGPRVRAYQSLHFTKPNGRPPEMRHIQRLYERYCIKNIEDVLTSFRQDQGQRPLLLARSSPESAQTTPVFCCEHQATPPTPFTERCNSGSLTTNKPGSSRGS